MKNHCLAKSINDASWYQFRVWVEYFGKVFKRVTVAVNPQYTSLECSGCGEVVTYDLIRHKTQQELSLVEDWIR